MGVAATAIFCAAVPVISVLVTATDGAGTNNYTTTRGLRVFDATAIKTAGAGGVGDTVQVLNAGDAITDAIDTGVPDQTVSRAGFVDDANYLIASGGTLRVTTTFNTNSACNIYIHCIPG